MVKPTANQITHLHVPVLRGTVPAGTPVLVGAIHPSEYKWSQVSCHNLSEDKCES